MLGLIELYYVAPADTDQNCHLLGEPMTRCKRSKVKSESD